MVKSIFQDKHNRRVVEFIQRNTKRIQSL